MKRFIPYTLGFMLLSSGLLLYGCTTTQQTTAMEKTGVQLWGENCARCHNAPPPSAFSDAEWEAITFHMRVRANLTEEEVQKIKEFLMASNG